MFARLGFWFSLWSLTACVSPKTPETPSSQSTSENTPTETPLEFSSPSKGERSLDSLRDDGSGSGSGSGSGASPSLKIAHSQSELQALQESLKTLGVDEKVAENWGKQREKFESILRVNDADGKKNLSQSLLAHQPIMQKASDGTVQKTGTGPLAEQLKSDEAVFLKEVVLEPLQILVRVVKKVQELVSQEEKNHLESGEKSPYFVFVGGDSQEVEEVTTHTEIFERLIDRLKDVKNPLGIPDALIQAVQSNETIVSVPFYPPLIGFLKKITIKDKSGNFGLSVKESLRLGGKYIRFGKWKNKDWQIRFEKIYKFLNAWDSFIEDESFFKIYSQDSNRNIPPGEDPLFQLGNLQKVLQGEQLLFQMSQESIQNGTNPVWLPLNKDSHNEKIDLLNWVDHRVRALNTLHERVTSPEELRKAKEGSGRKQILELGKKIIEWEPFSSHL